MGRSLNYRGLLIVGICLPAILAFTDHWILASLQVSSLSPLGTIALFVFFVAQVAIVSWAVPRFITPWPLRWFLWVWTLSLIDLQLGVISAVESFRGRLAIDGLAAAMLAGQLGALVVWGILGSGKVRWRLPSLLVLLFVLWNFYDLLVRTAQQPEVAYFNWDDLLFIDTTILACLCAAIRLQGFTLIVMAGEGATSPSESSSKPPLQFGIRHVLIGTTGLAILLGFAKAGHLLTSQFAERLYGESSLFIASVAIGTAAVLLVALWAALGQGSPALRVALAILLPLVIGGGVAWYCIAIGRPQIGVVNGRYWMMRWYATGYWWIGYMLLTALLLSSSLIIFRTLGYRLVRCQLPSMFTNVVPLAAKAV